MGSRASVSQPGLACGQQPVQIVAHRGGGSDPAPWGAPESSLLAFRRALELGAEAVECDVRVSADGLPFVSLREEELSLPPLGTEPRGWPAWPVSGYYHQGWLNQIGGGGGQVFISTN